MRKNVCGSFSIWVSILPFFFKYPWTVETTEMYEITAFNLNRVIAMKLLLRGPSEKHVS
jgi:hypothetical protein